MQKNEYKMFAKFMNKKFFHPGSYPNIKRRWMAEQKALAKEKKEQEMRETYEKEQQTYQHKMLLAKKDEDKIKLGLNFMYDLPPGMKKEGAGDEGNEEAEEVKFEWQKNAPRAMYAKKLGLDVHDQPFGVCVRNVKCFKCGKWGHQNVDKECPMFNENKTESPGTSALDSLCLSDPLRLISDMKRDHGLTLRKSVIGSEIDPMADNQQILDTDDEKDDPEIDIAFIESLSDKQKKKLLRKLEKMEKIKAKKAKCKKIDFSKKHSRKQRLSHVSSDSEWEERNNGDEDYRKCNKREKKFELKRNKTKRKDIHSKHASSSSRNKEHKKYREK